jgi:hypothetical protein
MDALLPLIFIIVWVIIGAQAHKRKKQQEAIERGEAPAGQEKPKTGSILDSLRESIETMARELEGKTTPPAIPTKRQTMGKPDVGAAEQHRLRRMKQKTKSEISLEQLAEGKRRDVHARAYQREEMRPYETNLTPYGPKAAQGMRYIKKDSFSVGELRKAFVWSEILQPPVSLREPKG